MIEAFQVEMFPETSNAQRPTPNVELRERDEAMARVQKNAGPEFTERAKAFVVGYLERHGPSSGESITSACKIAGITAHDDRAMGPVFMSLSRRGVIAKAGFCQRLRGHGTAGGIVWRLNDCRGSE